MAPLSMDIPFHIDGAGRVAAVSDPGRQTDMRIRNLISTMPYERVMRDRYGTGVGGALFDVDDPIQLRTLISDLQDNMQGWEPNAVLDDISITSQDPAGGSVELTVVYHQKATGDVRSFTVGVGATATYGWPEGG